jgi:hypothetical protein
LDVSSSLDIDGTHLMLGKGRGGRFSKSAGIGLVALVVAGIVSSLPNVGHFTPFGLNELASELALQQTAAGGSGRSSPTPVS